MAGFFSALVAFVIGFVAPTPIEIPPPPLVVERAASHVPAYNTSSEKIMPNGANPNAIDNAGPLVAVSPTPTPIVIIVPPGPDPIISPPPIVLPPVIEKPIPVPTYRIDPPPIDTTIHGGPAVGPNFFVSEAY